MSRLKTLDRLLSQSLLDVMEPVTASKSSSEGVTAKVPVESQTEASLPARPVASTGNTMLVEEVASSGKGVVTETVVTPTIQKPSTALVTEASMRS